jgi:hypothetical protein
VAQFRYRLQTLFDKKVQAKEEAQQCLAATQQELRKELDELEECRREQEARANGLQRARSETLSPAAGGSSGEFMRLKREYIARLEGEYHEASNATGAQELRVSEVKERLVAARDALASVSRDVEVLEKHRARLERRFAHEAERKEVCEQEEMANIMFLRGRTTR